MSKFIGVFFILGGMAGVLHSWIYEQKNRQREVELFLLFLQKSLSVMKNEKIKVADYFKREIEQNPLFEDNEMFLNTFIEILKRLSINTYPNGQMVWEEVFNENASYWNFDSEIFQIIVQAGNGFFGRTRDENISFLEKSIKELEILQIKIKDKHAHDRKIWTPVGMLGALMIVIILL